MTVAQWKQMMFETIDGLTAHLSASAPASARAQLAAARGKVSAAHDAATRRRCESRVNTLAESEPWFRGAAKRYLRPKVQKAILDATRVWIRAARVLPAEERRAAVEQRLAAFDNMQRRRRRVG